LVNPILASADGEDVKSVRLALYRIDGVFDEPFDNVVAAPCPVVRMILAAELLPELVPERYLAIDATEIDPILGSCCKAV